MASGIRSKQDQKEVQDMRQVLIQSMKSPAYFMRNMVDMEVYDYNEDYVDDLRQFLIYRSGRKSGKCFAVGSTIYTETGAVNVENLNTGDRLLSSIANVGKRFEDIGYEIKLSNGVAVKVNAEHKFYTQRGWVTADNLALSDMVECKMASEFNVQTKSLPSVDVAKLMGYLFSDGTFGAKQSVKFTNVNEDLLDDVKNIVAKNYPDLRTVLTKKGNGYDLHIVGNRQANNNPLKNLIRDWKLFGKNSMRDLQLLPYDQLVAFVQGFFNGDGSLSNSNRKGRSHKRVDLSFAIGISKELAREFQFILWRLGIQSTIQLQEHMKKSCGTFYAVRVYRKSEQLKLLKLLDDRKYPEKFALANKTLSEYSNNDKSTFYYGNYVKVKSIEEYGKDTFVEVASMDTEEIYSVCGMRTHNTISTAMKIVWYAYFAPYVLPDLKAHCDILIVAPAQHQAQIMMDWVKEIIGYSKLLKANIVKERIEEIHLEWIDGTGVTKIRTRAAGIRGSSVRGYEPNVLVIDETSFVSRNVIVSMIPSGMASKARIMLTSSPFGNQGYFYEKCASAKAGNELARKDGYDVKDGRWIQYYVPSTLNPKIKDNPEYLKEMQELTQDEYNTEVLGLFLEAGDALIAQKYLQQAYGDFTPPKQFNLYMGVDVARKGKDETVITVIAVNPAGKVFVLYCKSMAKTSIPNVAREVERVYDMYSKFGNINRVFYDVTALGAGAFDISQEAGLPVVGIPFSLQRKDRMYVNLTALFELGKIKIGSNEKLMRQLGYLRKEYTQKYLNPQSDEHDDYPDSLAVACTAVMSDEEFETVHDKDGKPMHIDQIFG